MLLLIGVILLFLVFSFIHYAAKKKKPFRWAFLSMLSGIAVLYGVNLCAGFSGVYVPVTQLTLLVSAVGGVPGVAVLVLLSVF